MYRTIIFGLAAALMLAGTASAQNNDSTGNGPSPASTNRTLDTASRDLRALSDGNQRIAKALFQAQQAVDGNRFWSLDGIAKAKQRAEQQGAGWGLVFNQMRRGGLIREQSIGQLIVGQDMARTADAAGATGATNASFGRLERSYRSNVVVTTADGRRVVVGLASPVNRPRTFAYASIKQAPAKPVRKIDVAKPEPEKTAPPANAVPERRQALAAPVKDIEVAQLVLEKIAFPVQPAPKRRIVYRLFTPIAKVR